MDTKIEGDVLVDTNILVYAHCGDKDERCEAAAKIILELGRSGKGVLSIQTLAESYWVMVYKRKPGLSPDLAKQMLTDYADAWRVIEPNKDTFLKAMDGVANYKMSFWDAMQWAIAFKNDIATIFTEDFTHGQIVEGIKFLNPFKI